MKLKSMQRSPAEEKIKKPICNEIKKYAKIRS